MPKSIPVEISASVLTWIISNINPIKVSPNNMELLLKWQSGEKKPTFAQIGKICHAIGIPLGYFFLETPPQEDTSLLNYRTIDSVKAYTPSRELMDTIHDMEMIQDWMRNVMISEGVTPLGFVGSKSENDNTDDIAKAIIDELELLPNWYVKFSSADIAFKEIRKKISTNGIIVMENSVVGFNNYRPLDIDEFRAFAIIDEYAPIIFINSSDSKAGRLFSLMHELVHIFLGTDSLYNYNNQKDLDADVSHIEVVCNAVAAEILIPKDEFLKQWKKSDMDEDDEIKINEIAGYFRCSSVSAARRALDFGFIKSPLYYKIAKTAAENYKKSRENNDSGNFYNTAISRIDARFLKMLASSVKEGKTLYTEAFRLTHTKQSTFNKLIKDIK